MYLVCYLCLWLFMCDASYSSSTLIGYSIFHLYPDLESFKGVFSRNILDEEIISKYFNSFLENVNSKYFNTPQV